MAVLCSTHERDREVYTEFWLENLKGRDHSELLVLDGRIILERISDLGCRLDSCDSE
jgi:hypothetical protein